MKPRTIKPVIFGIIALSGAQTLLAEEVVLPKPEAPFGGEIGATRKESIPAWPKQLAPPLGAPNVVVIVLDDVGFGAASTFGGPAATPGLDQLANTGLRYNQFHTNALCSPTRASLLSGRNHHQAGFGTITEGATGYPGYNGIWGKNVVSVGDVLKRNGYSTAAFGKWHNTPQGEVSAVGPFDRWPTGLGFDYFSGFHGGETSQWQPQLYRNTLAVQPKATPEQGYHLTTDLTDEAIQWLRQHESLAPQKPYFLYFATGATHAPHHVPKEWVAKYQGKFDQGWDKLREESFARQKQLGVIPANAQLTPRPKELPAWDSLSADQKKLYARQAEVYAAFLSHTDYEVGRLLQSVRQGPQGDNTLVFYIVGDNGASAEGTLDGSESNLAAFTGFKDDVQTQLKHIDELGGPLHDNHFASAWAWGNDAPFQWTKQIASHFGGTRNPLVVSWPAKIKDKGGLRSQFSHVSDVAPTIYEAVGVKFPDVVDGVKQVPLAGSSLAHSFDNANSPTTHRTQYFEMFGNRGIYQDGWVAAARHSVPWDWLTRTDDFGKDVWELYHVDEDFSEAKNLAEENPDKLKELQEAFDREARKNNVYPLSSGNILELAGADQPSLSKGRSSFTYYNGTVGIHNVNKPQVRGKAFRIEATADIPAQGAEGVLLADGGRHGGYTLYVKGGKLVFENNFVGKSRDIIASTESIPTGKVKLAVEFTPEGTGFFTGGTAKLFINGSAAGEGKIQRAGAWLSFEPLDVGQENGSPVSLAYQPPFKFTGNLEKVDFVVK